MFDCHFKIEIKGIDRSVISQMINRLYDNIATLELVSDPIQSLNFFGIRAKDGGENDLIIVNKNDVKKWIKQQIKMDANQF